MDCLLVILKLFVGIALLFALGNFIGYLLKLDEYIYRNKKK